MSLWRWLMARTKGSPNSVHEILENEAKGKQTALMTSAMVKELLSVEQDGLTETQRLAIAGMVALGYAETEENISAALRGGFRVRRLANGGAAVWRI